MKEFKKIDIVELTDTELDDIVGGPNHSGF